ncbi:FZO1 Mitofusin FZO1 [Candida maltosa Xu316]|uniref:Dynamin-type G domain-containing protein n=1 Tax=Candida maltosa (strain Xu316) TaxID=1245528 RepID=M3JSD4_CANMX|nr:hypothetical protein G210_5256 [Candida maltosa Xu316]
MSDFPNLDPDKKFRTEDAEEDDDKATLIDDQNLLSDPSHLIYVPGESSLTHDGTTVFDGQEGSSKKNGVTLRSQQKQINTTLQQLHYNDNKIALDRSINQTIDLIYEVQSENKERPIFYPTEIEDGANVLLNSAKAHLALVRQNSSIKTLDKAKIAKEEETLELPEFRILKINLKFGHDSETNSMANLDKQSIAKLLEKKLSSQVKYLLKLKDRIDDTSSKVFVTGDLNAGKSTFCNGLLRRKVLPEDQQPCTSVFCEVIDASKDNNGIEEVHAVPIGKEYNIRDESTFEAYSLKALEELVYDCDRFSLLKVYVLDHRSFQESLLRNGVIDIKLIDAPGLNMDSYQTTQVFSRQEEIDLVVFVVSAENHFTLSAKEFISAAANEKRFVFIVVNKFDHIKDKEKCKKRILDQIKSLSPETYKNAKEFVHFVSSDDVFNNGGDGGDGGDGDDDGDDGNPDNGEHPDFDLLEASLRKFILEKRSISKLLPAKDYLVNILRDFRTLSDINEKIYVNEQQDKLKELNNQVAPKFNSMVNKSKLMGNSINELIEKTCVEVYDDTNRQIVATVNDLSDTELVKYPGIQYLFEYAKEVQLSMLDTILYGVEQCEESAKAITAAKVEEIIQIGKSTLGEEFFNDKVFNSSLMFTRKRKNFGIDFNVDLWDFFDVSGDSIMAFVGYSKVGYLFNPLSVVKSSTRDVVYGLTTTLSTGAAVHKIVMNFSLFKKLAVPLVLGVVVVAGYFLVNDMPHAFVRNQRRKLLASITSYSHSNANRIEREVRDVLSFVSKEVFVTSYSIIDKKSSEKEKLEDAIKKAKNGAEFFQMLVNKVDSISRGVESINII